MDVLRGEDGCLARMSDNKHHQMFTQSFLVALQPAGPTTLDARQLDNQAARNGLINREDSGPDQFNLPLFGFQEETVLSD